MIVQNPEDAFARIRSLGAPYGEEIIQCIENEDVARLKAIACTLFQEKMSEKTPREEYRKLGKLVEVINGLFHSADFSAKKIYEYILQKGLDWRNKDPLLFVSGYMLSEIDECIHGESVRNKTSRYLEISRLPYVSKDKEQFQESIEKSKSALYDIGYLLAKIDSGFASCPGQSTPSVSFVGDNLTEQEKLEDFMSRPSLNVSLGVLDDQKMNISRDVSDRVKEVCKNQFRSFLEARRNPG